MRVATRLTILVAVCTVALLGLSAMAVYGFSNSTASLKTVYEDRTVPLEQLGEIRAAIQRNIQEVAFGTLEATPTAGQKASSAVDENLKIIQRNWQAYSATLMTARETDGARALDAARADFLDKAVHPILRALIAGNAPEARRLLQNEVPRYYPVVEKNINALVKLQIDVAEAEFRSASAHLATVRAAMIGAIVLAIALTIAIGIVIIRSVTQQVGGELQDIVAVASAIAEGRLDTPFEVAANMRASIAAAICNMQSSLVATVSQVRKGCSAISTAAREVSSGNADLSQRTESQASALQQTSATMDQLSAIVRLNAENAQQARQLAADAAGVASSGGQAVSQVVAVMREIDEDSRKISGIVTVMEGIAFQTNLLALNAAVEAARAGEAGRGFAVVAMEVRKLAQHSAKAARDVSVLVKDSIGRTGRADVLTENAIKAMADIRAAIGRVNGLVAEISTASTEQSTGVTQVTQAVGQIDQVTQQNAALVEQTAALTESMSQQATALEHEVARFRLPAAAV